MTLPTQSDAEFWEATARRHVAAKGSVLLSHFETERPAGFPDQAPTENVIGAGSTRQPASSSHAEAGA